MIDIMDITHGAAGRKPASSPSREAMPGASVAARARGGATASARSSRRRGYGTRSSATPGFDLVNARALAVLPALLARWLPDGRRQGNEYLARNPRRHDRNPGSFSINLVSGRWADFATGDKGGDVVSLVAYLGGLSQGDAARKLAATLGLEGRR
jgi:hypothetical protein